MGEADEVWEFDEQFQVWLWGDSGSNQFTGCGLYRLEECGWVGYVVKDGHTVGKFGPWHSADVARTEIIEKFRSLTNV